MAVDERIQRPRGLDVDANELPLVYRARGMAVDEAQRHAAAQLQNWPTTSEPPPEPGLDHDVVGSG